MAEDLRGVILDAVESHRRQVVAANSYRGRPNRYRDFADQIAKSTGDAVLTALSARASQSSAGEVE